MDCSPYLLRPLRSLAQAQVDLERRKALYEAALAHQAQTEPAEPADREE